MTAKLLQKSTAGKVALNLDNDQSVVDAIVDDPAFKAWFAGSKVTDSHGRPLRVFHGTRHSGGFDAFAPSPRGSLGSGIYFTNVKSTAEEYGDGGILLSAYLRMVNPIHVRADFALAEEQFDFESEALPLLQQIFNEEQVKKMVHKSLWSDGMFGSEVQRRVEELGYDGIIATYEDGGVNFIVFKPQQAKIANRHPVKLASGITTLYRGVEDEARKGGIEKGNWAATFFSTDQPSAAQYGHVTEYQADLTNARILRIDDIKKDRKAAEDVRKALVCAGTIDPVDGETFWNGLHAQGPYIGENGEYSDEISDQFLFPVKSFAAWMTASGYDGTQIGPDIALFDAAKWVKPTQKTAAMAEPEPDWIKNLNDQGNGVTVVYTRSTYDGLFAITVNNPTRASYVALFLDGKKIGEMVTDTSKRDGHTYAKIGGIEIPKKYRGRGFGREMYKALLAHTDTEGIQSYLPDRTNKKQVPKIYKALGGQIEGDYAIIPKTAAITIRAFHGTRAGSFDEFQPHIRKGEQLGFGIHFTTDKKFAERYAYEDLTARRGKAPMVYTVDLSVTNPLVADTLVVEGKPEFELAKKLAGPRLVTDKNEHGKRCAWMQNAIDATSPLRAEKLIQQAGYDSVTYMAEITSSAGPGRYSSHAKGASYLVFEPSQVKIVSKETLPEEERPKFSGKYGFISAELPHASEAEDYIGAVRADIADDDLAGKGKDVNGDHLTLRYGLIGDDIAGVQEYLATLPPIQVTLRATESFEPSSSSQGTAPVIVPVDSSELHKIFEELGKCGSFSVPDFDYSPHITVAYVRPEAAEKYVGDKRTKGQVTLTAILIHEGNGRVTRVELGRAKTASAPSDAKERALKEIESRAGSRFKSWLIDYIGDDPDPTFGEVWADEPLRLEYLCDWLEEEHGIRVEDDGCCMFWKLTPAVEKLIGDLPVLLYHHTNTALLPKIKREGLRSDVKRSNPYDNSGAGVYLTTEASGAAVDGYLRNVGQRFRSGSGVSLLVKTYIADLQSDPDDAEIESGNYQFVLPEVAPSDIVFPQRKKPESKKPQSRSEYLAKLKSGYSWGPDILFADLQVGDGLSVDGAVADVVSVNPNGTVTLKDGADGSTEEWAPADFKHLRVLVGRNKVVHKVAAVRKVSMNITVPPAMIEDGHFWEEPPPGHEEFWAFRWPVRAQVGDRISFNLNKKPIAEAVIARIEKPGQSEDAKTGKYANMWKVYWTQSSFRDLRGQEKTAALKTAMPALPESRKAEVFYHGTAGRNRAKSIIEKGLIPNFHSNYGKGLEAMEGRLYVTSSLSEALSAAAGVGVADDTRYIFVIDGHDLSGDVVPDEDMVGEWAMAFGDQLYKGWEPVEPLPLPNAVLEFFRESVTKERYSRVETGDITQFAQIGKELLAIMPDDVKLALVELAPALAHEGAVLPQACWSFSPQQWRKGEITPKSFYDKARFVWSQDAKPQKKAAAIKSSEFPAVLPDAWAIADYIQTYSPSEVNYYLIEEEFRDCRAVLRRVPIASLTPGDPDHNIRNRQKEWRYKQRPLETLPPLVVEDGEIKDGGHRFRAAVARGVTDIWCYDVEQITETSKTAYLDRSTGNAYRWKRGASKTAAGDVTQTPEFKRWFAGSKVVDEQGRPLRVYHGAARDNDEWRPGKPTYFTDSPEDASAIAVDAIWEDGDNPFVAPCYLSIKNPKRLPTFDEDEFDSNTLNVHPENVEKLKSEGYDGVFGVDAKHPNGPVIEYVAFGPHQIRPAFGDASKTAYLDRSTGNAYRFVTWLNKRKVQHEDHVSPYGASVVTVHLPSTEEGQTIDLKLCFVNKEPEEGTEPADIHVGPGGVNPSMARTIISEFLRTPLAPGDTSPLDKRIGKRQMTGVTPDMLSKVTAILQDLRETEGPGQCYQMSEILDKEFGWRIASGFHQDPGTAPCKHHDHSWNVLKDGTIVDGTHDQFGPPDVAVLKPGDPEYALYHEYCGNFDCPLCTCENCNPDFVEEAKRQGAKTAAANRPFKEWLGKTPQTGMANARDLTVTKFKNEEDVQPEPFMDGKYTIVKGNHSYQRGFQGTGETVHQGFYTVFDGEKPIASMCQGSLVVDKKYRGQGIGLELAKAFMRDYPNYRPSSVNPKSKRLFERAFDELQGGSKTAAKYSKPPEPRPPQESTPAFKAWFGGSKVTDRNGNPLIVYHGAPDLRFLKEIGAFQSWRERHPTHTPVGEPDPYKVFFFAGNRAIAATYADDRRAWDYQNAEPGVFAAYLSIKNPYVVDQGGKKWKGTDKVYEAAKAQGCDGIIIRNSIDDYQVKGKVMTDVFAVFSSEQIKAAEGNSGGFNAGEKSVYAAITMKTKTLWHGTATDFADLRPNDYGIIWLGEKRTAQEYAKMDKFFKDDSARCRLIPVKLTPDAKIIDLRDDSDPDVQAFKEVAGAKWNTTHLVLENRWAVPWLKEHHIDAVIVDDNLGHVLRDHDALAVINPDVAHSGPMQHRTNYGYQSEEDSTTSL